MNINDMKYGYFFHMYLRKASDTDWSVILWNMINVISDPKKHYDNNLTKIGQWMYLRIPHFVKNVAYRDKFMVMFELDNEQKLTVL